MPVLKNIASETKDAEACILAKNFRPASEPLFKALASSIWATEV